MPVVEGQVFLQVALVFGLIGLLGLVMRWTFHRDTAEPPARAEPEATRSDAAEASPTSPPAPPAGPASRAAKAASGGGKQSGKRKHKAKAASNVGADQGAGSAPAGNPPRTAPAAAPQRSAEREDYGLLAVAAEVGTAEEAAKVRLVLTAAGIRNTNTVTGDGRHRVLVFGDELIRARRVAGGAHGAGGGSTGTGGS